MCDLFSIANGYQMALITMLPYQHQGAQSREDLGGNSAVETLKEHQSN
jgi:hypothetical protein